MKLRCLVVFLLAVCIRPAAFARDVVFGKGRETIPVAFGIQTLFRFPLEVKTVTEASRFDIRPANTEEPDYSVLAVKPRMSEGSAEVTFILSDGTVIRTQLLITNRPHMKRDSIYDFKPREDLPQTNPNLSDKRDPMVISELDLMRAMVRGDQIAGFNVSSTSQAIDLGTPEMKATLVKVYRGRDVNGYIYHLTTDTSVKRFQVDLKDLAVGAPNLAILAQIDRASLGGKTASERQTQGAISAPNEHQMRRRVAQERLKMAHSAPHSAELGYR